MRVRVCMRVHAYMRVHLLYAYVHVRVVYAYVHVRVWSACLCECLCLHVCVCLYESVCICLSVEKKLRDSMRCISAQHYYSHKECVSKGNGSYECMDLATFSSFLKDYTHTQSGHSFKTPLKNNIKNPECIFVITFSHPGG